MLAVITAVLYSVSLHTRLSERGVSSPGNDPNVKMPKKNSRRAQSRPSNVLRLPFTFELQTATKSTITVDNIKEGGFDPRMPFRPLKLFVEAIADTKPVVLGCAGFSTESSSQPVVVGPEKIVGSIGKKFSMRWPRQSTWFPANTVGAWPIYYIESNCESKARSSLTALCNGWLLVEIGRVETDPSCPKMSRNVTNLDPPHSSVFCK